MPGPILSAAGLPAINAGLFATSGSAGALSQTAVAAGDAATIGSPFASQFASRLSQSMALTPTPAAALPGVVNAAAAGDVAALIGVATAPAGDAKPPSAALSGAATPTLPSELTTLALPPDAGPVAPAGGDKPPKSPIGQEHTLPMPTPWTAPWRSATASVDSDVPVSSPVDPSRWNVTDSPAPPPAAAEANDIPVSRIEPAAATDPAGDAGAQSMAAWIAQLLPAPATPVSPAPSEVGGASGKSKPAVVPTTGAPGTALTAPSTGGDIPLDAAAAQPPVQAAKASPLPGREATPLRRSESALPSAPSRRDAGWRADSPKLDTTAPGDTADSTAAAGRPPGDDTTAGAAPAQAPAVEAAVAAPTAPPEPPAPPAVLPPPPQLTPALARPAEAGSGQPALAVAEGATQARRPEAALAGREPSVPAASRPSADKLTERGGVTRAEPGLQAASIAEAAAPSLRDEAHTSAADTAHKPAFAHLLDAANQAQASMQTSSASAIHTTAAAVVDVALTTPVLAPEFREALGVHVSMLARDGVQHAELHLNPGDMGPISVRIALDGTQAQVDFGVDSAATRSLVESGMPELASALRDAGLTLSGGGVSQHPRGQAGDSPQGGRSGDGAPSDQPGGPRLRGGQGDDASAALPRPRTLRMAGGVDLYA